MNEIGMLLKRDRTEAKMSQGALSKALEDYGINLSPKTISGYENGVSEPNASLFLIMCEVLKIADPVNEYACLRNKDSAYLNSEGMEKVREYMSLLMNDPKYRSDFAEDPAASTWQSGHASHVAAARSNISASKQNIVPINTAGKSASKTAAAKKSSDKVLSIEKAASISKKTSSRRKASVIRIFDNAVSAGTGDFLDSENYELKEIDETVPNGADFGVRVSGDSMMPRINDGDIIYIKKQDTLENGEIGIFSLDGNAYVKKLKSTRSGLSLISLNKKYSPIKVGEYSDFKIFGKALI